MFLRNFNVMSIIYHEKLPDNASDVLNKQNDYAYILTVH